MSYLLTVFFTILLAELGDKTQLAVLLYASQPGVSKAGIAVAGSLALVSATLVAVLVGEKLGQWIEPKIVGLVSGGAFIVIGAWLIFEAWSSSPAS